MRGDNLSKVDLSKYHTEGKSTHYIQLDHIVKQLTMQYYGRQDQSRRVRLHAGPENTDVEDRS